IAETDSLVGLGRREENAPTVVGHVYVVEMRPTVGVDADGGAEINVFLLKTVGADLAPPVEVARQPFDEGALQPFVRGQVDVVRNLFVRYSHHMSSFACSLAQGQVRLQSKVGRSGLPYRDSAPCSPTAFGRLKIQFCHADRRPK